MQAWATQDCRGRRSSVCCSSAEEDPIDLMIHRERARRVTWLPLPWGYAATTKNELQAQHLRESKELYNGIDGLLEILLIEERYLPDISLRTIRSCTNILFEISPIEVPSTVSKVGMHE